MTYVVAGDSVAVDVTCSNTGDEAARIVARVANSQALDVSPTSQDLGVIPPGSSGKATFTISTASYIDSRRYIITFECILPNFPSVVPQELTVGIVVEEPSVLAGIPGFPIESILAGLVVGVAVLTVLRRRRNRQSSCSYPDINKS
jgi:hypothetical protein